MITRNTSFGYPAPAGSPAPPPAPGIREVCRILYRHKRKMAIVFCLTLSLVVVGVIFFPRSYTSESRLFVRLGKESVGLDPTATTQEVMNVNDSRESEINSELEILRSRALLEDVVAELGADEVLYSTAAGGKGSWTNVLTMPIEAARGLIDGAIGADERAVTKLSKSISVSSPRRSSVLILKCKARDPAKAQRILQAFVSAYMVRHAKANRISGSHDFFVAQSDLLRDQLTLANQELRDAKNENNLASIEGQRQNVQAQASSIEVAMLDNQRALSSVEARVAALKKALTELPEQELAEESDMPSTALDLMRTELYRVQIQEKEASSKFTALHPTVIALRRQVEETRHILAAEEAHRSQSTRRLSPVHQAIQTELATTQATAAANQAESESLKQQFEAVQSKIRALNDSELRVTQLERKSELLEESYRQYAAFREQARIDGALEVGRISNVNVVQAATFVAKPSSPSVLLTLAVGFVLALSGAMFAAFVAESFDRTLKTPEQIETELGVPVLFSVPRVPRDDLVRS